jgi:hypothetical protein
MVARRAWWRRGLKRKRESAVVVVVEVEGLEVVVMVQRKALIKELPGRALQTPREVAAAHGRRRREGMCRLIDRLLPRRCQESEVVVALGWQIDTDYG